MLDPIWAINTAFVFVLWRTTYSLFMKALIIAPELHTELRSCSTESQKIAETCEGNS